MRFFLLFTLTLSSSLMALPPGLHTDESKVPDFELPLLFPEGTSAAKWNDDLRAETLTLFEKEMFGKVPAISRKASAKLGKKVPDFLNGKAVLQEVVVSLVGKEEGPKLNLLIITPSSAKGPVPVFLGLNFKGNHTIHATEEITVGGESQVARGERAGRWQVEKIIDRGYGLVTAFYGDIDLDKNDGFKDGIHGAVESSEKRDGSSWGSIAAWVWGLSRGLDFLETYEPVDGSKVVAFGHSRLGKTSLWAGATDERFAGVISNNSGCGGAALSRRAFGETVGRINKSFPHWFCENFHAYGKRENELPFDQHQLVALMAPRPVYIASAQDDQWADPKGEFPSAKHADPVYRLLGKDGLDQEEMPKVDQPVGKTIRYHMRSGKHDVKAYDWEQYLKMMDELIR
jgi:hypothetical protein